MARSNQETSTVNEADPYKLQRNFHSSIRLNAQHYLWKDAVGYNIHPDIPVLNDPSFKVADVGTGTGIWVTDVKREYPKVRVDGFDLSLDQAPPSQWMPSGSSLVVLDARLPPPSRFHHQYDLVHIRLFLAVVEDNDPSPILDHALKLLKPGGWIQWSEHDLQDISCESVGADTDAQSPPCCAMRQFVELIYNTNVGRRLFWTQMQFNSTMDYTFVALDNSTPGSAGPEAREVIARAADEAKSGLALSFVPTTTIGRYLTA